MTEIDVKKALANIKIHEKKYKILSEKIYSLLDYQYFLDSENGIYASFKRADLSRPTIEICIDFNISMFSDIIKTVPILRNEEGMLVKTNARNCIHKYLIRSKKEGLLYKNINFNVYNNNTVRFSITKDEYNLLPEKNPLTTTSHTNDGGWSSTTYDEEFSEC